MYNRYIPQNDGSYRRKAMPDKCPPPPKPGPKPCPPPKEPPCCPPPPPCPPPRPVRHTSAGSFLKNLLPRDLDTGDLLVILLLFLISGDREEDRSNALLTLAIYLLM